MNRRTLLERIGTVTAAAGGVAAVGATDGLPVNPDEIEMPEGVTKMAVETHTGPITICCQSFCGTPYSGECDQCIDCG